MPNTLGNRVKMSVSGTPGTGTITLGSAVSGFQTFAAAGIPNAATVPYVIEDGSNWEIGVGTYTSSGTTLARTSITASSNSGSAISATSGAIVMISPLAADLQVGTAAGNLVQIDNNSGITIPGTLLMGSSFLRNRVINGQCAVDQRYVGTATVLANAAYGPDRWKIFGEDNLGKLTGRDGTIGGGRYNGVVTCVTANNKYGVGQYIEGINCKDLRGKTVTLSAVLAVSNARLGNIKMGIIEWTGTEDSMTSNMVSTWGADGTTPTLASNFSFKNTPANLSVTTTAATYSVSATLGSTFNNLAVFIWNDDKAFNANDALYFTDVQLEDGVATKYERRLATQELILCQRYFCKSAVQSTQPKQNNGDTSSLFGIGVGTQVWCRWAFPVTMRSAPNIVTYNPTAANANWSANPTSPTVNLGTGNDTMTFIYGTSASAGNGYYLSASAEVEL